MKANELRIGNILKSDTHNAIFRVISIDLDRNYDTVSGIPLSEELLLKCGFETATDSFRGYLSPSFRGGQRIRIRTTNSGNFIYQLNKESNPLYIESLHQLQNLFNSLSGGQELNTSGLI